MNKKINGIRIRSKCDWYKYGERSSILKNLELHKAQTEILQKMKKNLNVIKQLMKNFLTVIKTYSQKILTCPRMKLHKLDCEVRL